MQTLGPIYKLACIAVAISGFLVAFPMLVFIGFMTMQADFGWLVLLALWVLIGVTAWGVLVGLLHLQSMARQSFVAPTIAALVGLILIFTGSAFAQHPPSA